MATTNLYLDRRGKASDGKGTIVIIIQHRQTTASISTGIRVKPDNWRDKQVVKLSDASVLNAKLAALKGDIDRKVARLSLEEDFQCISATDIKHRIENKIIEKPSSSFIKDIFEEYINGGTLKDGTKDIYRITLSKVLSYGGPGVDIKDINLKWLRGFDKYLAKTQGINGKAIYLRSLRAIFNYAQSNDIPCAYPFDSFKIKQEPTIKRSIPVDKLKLLREYPVKHSLEIYRDYFFLMFYLIGINVKDLLLAKKDQVIKGRLVYTREKTGKQYSVLIQPEAEKLIDKYYGKGEYLLDAMDHNKHYKSFMRSINDNLQLIGPTVKTMSAEGDSLFPEMETAEEVKPIIPGLTTYYARHSWATLAYEIGISMDIISQALGHSFGNRTTLIYVKPDQNKVDLANRRVIDYLNNSSVPDDADIC